MNLTSPRRYTVPYTGSEPTAVTSMSLHTDWALWVTYHSILYNITGSLTSYSGSGVATIDFHRASDDKYLFSVDSIGGGGFTGSWYDNTEQIYSSAWQDSTHLGRSANALAAGNP